MYIDLGGHNYGPITLTVTTSGYHKDPGWDIKVSLPLYETEFYMWLKLQFPRILLDHPSEML